MLVLARKENEAITIDTPDGKIVIKILSIYYDSIRLGIEKPTEMAIEIVKLKPDSKKAKG